MTDMYDAEAEGERRHEQCRFGDLTASVEVNAADLAAGREDYRPGPALPLCRWKSDRPMPPAIDRAWGGLVEFERDCAVCGCFRPLTDGPDKADEAS